MPIFGALAGMAAKRALTGGTMRRVMGAVAPSIVGKAARPLASAAAAVGLGAVGARLFGGRRPRRRRRMSMEKLLMLKTLGGQRSIAFQIGLLKFSK